MIGIEKAKRIKPGEYTYRGYDIKKTTKREFRNGYSAWNGWKLVSYWQTSKDLQAHDLCGTIKEAQGTIDYRIEKNL